MTEHDASTTTPPHALAPGDPPPAFTVDPRRRYVPTGIVVRPGERYRITATGTWRDASKLCGPEAWGGRWLKRWARLRGAALFELCGSIGRDDTHGFAIGRTIDWTASAGVALGDAPVLYLFAND
jgi:hypothetical protein